MRVSRIESHLSKFERTKHRSPKSPRSGFTIAELIEGKDPEGRFKSYDQIVNTKLRERFESEDLVYLNYSVWQKFQERFSGKSFIDEYAFFANDGVYTSKTELESQKVSLPNLHELKWNKSYGIWEIKNLVTTTTAKNLLDLLDNAEIAPTDERFTDALAIVQGFGNRKTMRFINSVVEGISGELSEESCKELGYQYNEGAHRKLKDIENQIKHLTDEMLTLLLGGE